MKTNKAQFREVHAVVSSRSARTQWWWPDRRSGWGTSVLRVASAAALVGLVMAVGSPGLAQGHKPETGMVMTEVVRASEQGKMKTMAMWYPHELWEAVIREQSKLSPRQQQAAIEQFEQYVIVVVLRMEEGIFGDTRFDNDAEIRRGSSSWTRPESPIAR
jgi:hypothetical protein